MTLKRVLIFNLWHMSKSFYWLQNVLYGESKNEKKKGKKKDLLRPEIWNSETFEWIWVILETICCHNLAIIDEGKNTQIFWLKITCKPRIIAPKKGKSWLLTVLHQKKTITDKKWKANSVFSQLRQLFILKSVWKGFEKFILRYIF